MQVKRFYEFGPFRLDPDERTLWREGEPVPMTLKAFETLLALVESGGRVIGKQELMNKVWPDAFVEENNLAQQVSFLRKALGETDSGTKYIETIPKRGYRFIVAPRQVEEGSNAIAGLIVKESVRAHVLIEEEDETSEEAESPESHIAGSGLPQTLPSILLPTREPAGAARWRGRKFIALLTACLVVVLVILAYIIYSKRTAQPNTRAGPRTLAILPFRNLKADADTDFLGFSLADSIITKLGYVSTIVVRPSSYVDKYRNREIDPKAAAAELNVNTLLTGSFLREGDDLRISAQLVDVEGSEILWRESFDLKYEKLLTVEDHVAGRVIEGLKLKLSPSEAEHLKMDAPHDPLAYEYYLRGVDLYSANEFNLAIGMFKKSIALDPTYAQTWAHLGTAYTAEAAFSFGGREDYLRAISAYEKALALNPAQIEARIFMANLFSDTNRLGQAVPLLREALKTNANYALAHWELGYAYRFAGVLDESIAECELARTLDPQVKLHSSALNSYLYAGEYEKFLGSLPPDTDVAFIIFYHGLAKLYLKDETAAVANFDRAYELDPSLYTHIGKAFSYAIGGESRKGLDLLRETERKMDERGVSDAEAMYKIAQAYTFLGDKSSAIRMLRRSIEGGFFCYPYIKDDPLLAKIRGEAEYANLLEVARNLHEEFKSRFF